MALFEKRALGNRDRCSFETRTMFWRARVCVLTRVKGFVCIIVRGKMWGMGMWNVDARVYQVIWPQKRYIYL